MTDSLTPQLDARHAAERGDDFTAEQMHAIDRAVVRVYVKARAVLPPDMLGAGKGDPAAALRAIAYEYALTHRGDISSRSDWQITHHIAGRLQQYVTRAVKARMERPYGIGQEFTSRLEDRQQQTRIRVVQPPPRVDSPINHRSIDLYGRILPPDQMQFMVKGRRNGKPVFEDPAVIAKLHTRKPTRTEFWEEVCTEWDRQRFRIQIAEAFTDGICSCDRCTTS